MSVLSDHYLVTADADLEQQKTLIKHMQYRKLKSIDMKSFKDDITTTFATHPVSSSAENAIVKYNNTLSNVLDKHAPMKSKREIPRKTAPWYNDNIHEAKEKRRQIDRLHRRTKLEVHREMFKSQRNLVNKLTIKAKGSHISDQIDNAGDKAIFAITKSLLGSRDSRKLPDYTSGNELSGRFGNYFCVKTRLIQESMSLAEMPDLQDYEVSSVFTEFDRVCESDIKELIMSSPNKTNDLDPCPTSLLKEVCDVICPHLTDIIQLSLETGIVPSCLKSALVTPLLKKPSLDENDMKNYRPVSNIPFVAKLLEKVVVSQLNNHLVQNDLLERCQSAYKSNHSTETALLKVHNDIVLDLANGKVVVLVLLDLSAAFDTVHHGILLDILKQNGVGGTVLKWFESYLTERSQKVYIDREGINTDSQDCGVPQGSVLGPVLFTLYTASLGKLLRSQRTPYHLYADDSQIHVSFSPGDSGEASETISRLENCIKCVRQWMTSHRLKMNDSKTEILVISRKRLDLDISINVGDTTPEISKSARNIGVVFDSKMSLELHV